MTTEQIAADTERLAFHRAVQTEGERSPAQQVLSLSKDDLLERLESCQHPAIRRVIGEMLYTMGQRHQVVAREIAL